ncbi:MAG: polyprenyl synthetase family protein [Desulfobacteraceae bacterium]|nr:MAG: polyprenyl synthetase family protein [Desulfobacteraceae bacterium]
MDSDRRFLSQFDTHFEAINQALTKPLDTPIPLIRDIGAHSLLGEGKRLRPLLFVLSARLCGYGSRKVYRYSSVFEYIHTASLLHDDVLDNAETRRRKPAVRNVWGNSAAILGGDYFYAKASLVALEIDKSELTRILTETTIRMVEGQFLELNHAHDWRMAKDQYMQIISAKTAELIAAACACGGVVADADRKKVRKLSGFGLNLGISFQLIDDLLDYFSSEEQFGKPVGKDLKEGKITLPLIYALERLKRNEAERLADRFRNNTAKEEEYSKVVALVRQSGVRELIRADAVAYAARAAGFLDSFAESPFKKALLDLNSYLVERSF